MAHELAMVLRRGLSMDHDLRSDKWDVHFERALHGRYYLIGANLVCSVDYRSVVGVYI